MLNLHASASNGQWQLCGMDARHCALLLATELPALIRACVKPAPLGPEDEIIPPFVLEGMPPPTVALDDVDEDNLNAVGTPTASAVPLEAVHGRTIVHDAGAINHSLLLLGGGEWHVHVSAQDVLVVLPPCRADAAGWAVGLGISGELNLDSVDGYERISLRVYPRIDGSPLAPLEEAPPSWLQPSLGSLWAKGGAARWLRGRRGRVSSGCQRFCRDVAAARSGVRGRLGDGRAARGAAASERRLHRRAAARPRTARPCAGAHVACQPLPDTRNLRAPTRQASSRDATTTT